MVAACIDTANLCLFIYFSESATGQPIEKRSRGLKPFCKTAALAANFITAGVNECEHLVYINLRAPG